MAKKKATKKKVVKKSPHQKLLDEAKDAVETLNMDDSVSIEQTIKSLNDVKDHIDACIEALNDDLEAGRE